MGRQASGISRPKVSRVIASGAGPPHAGVKGVVAADSASVISKSKTSKFSAMRCGFVDFGNASALLQVPAQHHLGWRLVVGLRDLVRPG